MVCPLLISPIFRWSMEKYGILYFSISFCERAVLPVCVVPEIKITIKVY